MIVLGIDPGTVYLGYGVIETRGNQAAAIDYGRVKIKSNLPFAEKLKLIYDSVCELIEKTASDVMAVEDVFVSCNAKTSLKLGHARGVVLLAAAHHHVPVSEYAPREIKQAVIGRGNASKSQIQWIMAQMLNLNGQTLEEDAADGLAVALCHGLRARSSALIKGLK
ncbi:crossover junction endodeoxyribonuclease RuvC [bacterium]|nr:crossover junction endodeoxyribonuclease RuvC [bacterium]